MTPEYQLTILRERLTDERRAVRAALRAIPDRGIGAEAVDFRAALSAYDQALARELGMRSMATALLGAAVVDPMIECANLAAARLDRESGLA